jgi:hypothetical protein
MIVHLVASWKQGATNYAVEVIMQREEIQQYGLQVMEEAVKRPGGLGVQKNWYHHVAGSTMRHIDNYGTTQQLIDFMQNVMSGKFDGFHILERIEVYSEQIAHLRAITQREAREKGLNVEWAQKVQVLMGIEVTIPMECTIEAVKLPDGNVVISPYLNGNAHNSTVNSEEAKLYLGRTGVIIGVSFQQRDIQMTDGVIITLLVAERKDPR